jgi:hypothetical protein
MGSRMGIRRGHKRAFGTEAGPGMEPVARDGTGRGPKL